MPKVAILIFLLGTVLSGAPAWGQVRIAKVLSPSEINRYESSHLVLIDFWATWCAPCINVGKQLEITQKRFKEDLTIISLSNESEPVVQKFIDAHHPKLTIALDAENYTFNTFRVTRSLPYAVLLNQRGQVLWKGHPANLSAAMIDKFVKRCQGLSPTNFITYMEQKPIPRQPGRTDQFSVRLSSSEDRYLRVSEQGVEFLGRCGKLFSEVLKKSRHEIVVDRDRVVQASIGTLNWNMGAEVTLDKVLSELGMSREIKTENTTYYWLTVTDPGRLWDDTQISLADYDGAFLVGNDSITLDNATVEEFAFRLADTLDHPVYTNYDSPVLHDWLVHYKYFGMTKEQLEIEYGIRLELKTGVHQLHHFR